jgi:hypothetical protein
MWFGLNCLRAVLNGDFVVISSVQNSDKHADGSQPVARRHFQRQVIEEPMLFCA